MKSARQMCTTLSVMVFSLSLMACRSVSLNEAPVVERSVDNFPLNAGSMGASGSGGAAGASNSASTPVFTSVLSAPYTLPPGASANASNMGSSNLSGTATPAPSPRPSTSGAMAAPTSVALPRPVAVSDGNSHVVKKGDTLFSIALENGLAYRDLAAWNNISNVSYIQIDQVLRLTAPSSAGLAAAPNAASSVAQAMPIAVPSAVGSSVSSVLSAPVFSSPVIAPSTAPVAPSAAAAPAAIKPAPAGELVWQWPAKGKPSAAFVEGKSKGLDIAGSLGDPILAAADGTVVYSGSALKGYGQMLIIKHNEQFLTAYAHNSRLLVREDAVVKRGQKIAEMGNSESDNGQVKLHFELRRSGKPIDPSKTLPAQ